MFVSVDNHEYASSGNGYNAYIVTNSETSEESSSDENLKLGPQSPSGRSLHRHLSEFGLVSILKSNDLWRFSSSEQNSKILSSSRRTGEQFLSVVDKHHHTIYDGSSHYGQDHVGCKFKPTDVIVSKRYNEDILWVSSHGKSRSNVGSRGQRKKVWQGVSNAMSDAKVYNNSTEDKDNRVVHYC